MAGHLPVALPVFQPEETNHAEPTQIFGHQEDHQHRAAPIGIVWGMVMDIFRKNSEAVSLAILDSFKTLLKSQAWPLILIFRGVEELAGYIESEPQLFRLMTTHHFSNVTHPEGFQTIHEVVGSYAIDGKIEVAGDLAGEDFYKRLAVAAAFR